MLSFDAEGRLAAIELNVSALDARSGVEFFSGMLVPAVEGACFEVGTCPGVALIDRVEWATFTPAEGAKCMKIL